MYEFGRWGLQVSDYCNLFDLSENQLKTKLLEYGCGPTALNADVHQTASLMVSCDPLFKLDKNAIEISITQYLERLKATKFDFETIAHKEKAFLAFLNDYEQGKMAHRYLATESCQLPFSDFTFDLALSAYHLFEDGDVHDVEKPLSVVIELARVAKEVRVFPLTDALGKPSPILGPLLLMLQKNNYGVEIREVVDHVLPENKAMLRVWALQCQIS